MEDRITLGMSTMDAIVALAEGNPGATTVLTALLRDGRNIDPDAMLQGLTPLFSLDVMGIYGPSIWMLYKDVCEENLVRVVGLLRAVQLGLLREDELQHAISNRGDGINAIDICDKVREQLPSFSERYREEGVIA